MEEFLVIFVQLLWNSGTDWMMVCVQRCGRRLSWPVAMCCPGIDVDRLRRTKNF